MRRATPLLLTVGLTGTVLIGLSTAQASSPDSSTLDVPTSGASAPSTWTGSFGPNANAVGCDDASSASKDSHSLKVVVPAGLYKTATSSTKISAHAVGGASIDMSVSDASGADLASGGDGSGDVSVTLTDLAAGTYSVTVCNDLGAGDDYTAMAVSTTKARPSTGGGTAGGAAGPLMTFTPATVVDPVLFGGEPGINFDQTSAGGNQRSFIDWPVTSRTMIGVLFRSEDGGLSYTKRYADTSDLTNAGAACATRQVPYCLAGGGGDTDIDINPTTGTVAMGEQESLANQAVGVSLDHGTTFPADHVDPALDKTGSGVDRQWQASWKGTKTRFIAYHVPLVGEFIDRSDDDGATGSWTVPATAQIPGVTQSGSLVTDNTGGPLNNTLYVGYIGAGALVPGAASGFAVGVSTDGAKTFVSHEIPGAGSPRSFTTLNVDKAGNLYAVWVDSSTQMTYLATSLASDPVNRAAPATKWSKPVMVSRQPLNVTIFGNVVAGTAGRVALGYYGTAAKAATPDAVLPGQGGWKPYLAFSSNALCQWDAKPCTSPTFSQDPIAHKINHDTNICTSGTTCAASTTANRNLLDYFAIDVDKAGHLGFVWSDTNNATLEPFVKVTRQASGPSLFAGQPNASLPQRGNGYPDTLGDAKYPIAGASVLTAANQKALDLAGTTLQRASNGDVVVTMSIPGLKASEAGVLPGDGNGVDGSGTPLQQARFVTRWDYQGQAYYAEATLGGGEGDITYGSGTVSAAEGVFNAGNVTATLGNTYAPLTPATGGLGAGKLTIRVPAAAVGAPKKGFTLYSVGSYSLIGANTDASGTLQVLPLTVDSSPTMDVAFGQTVNGVPGTVPPGTGTPPPLVAPLPHKTLATTGLDATLAGIAALMLFASLLLHRRRSHA